jgi:CRP/FNR family transcriptional regulator
MGYTAASHAFPCETCPVRDQTICSVLTNEELKELNAITTAVNLSPNEVVFYEEDENTYLFNVVSGAIRLSKLLPDGRRQITGFLFPGDFLGLSIADTYAYTAEAGETHQTPGTISEARTSLAGSRFQ